MFPSLNFWKWTFIKLLVKYVPTIPIILFVFNIKLFQLVYTCYEQGTVESVCTQFVCEFFIIIFSTNARRLTEESYSSAFATNTLLSSQPVFTRKNHKVSRLEYIKRN